MLTSIIYTSQNENYSTGVSPEKHELIHMGKTRRRCVNCYKTNSLASGRAFAQLRTIQVPWKCSTCQSFYCVPCFSSGHIH